MAAITKHVVLWAKHSAQEPKPKHHAIRCMTLAMERCGNPRYYATWLDETVNALVARIARSVHPAHFALEVMKKYMLLRTIDKLPY